MCGEGGSFGAEEAEQDAVAMVVFITRQNLKKNCKNRATVEGGKEEKQQGDDRRFHPMNGFPAPFLFFISLFEKQQFKPFTG